MLPTLIGAVALSLGYVAAAYTTTLWQFALVQGLLIAMFGGAASFGPIVADISHWFTRRRGIAVAIAASGNYLAGAIWPPVIQHFVQAVGWREVHLGIGVVVAVTMIPLALALRRKAPAQTAGRCINMPRRISSLGLSPAALQTVLAIAGFCCCVAMSMPQVNIVAYCSDLGYGVNRGAEMLSLMLALGIVSRVGSGFVADRIGGLPTLLLGSMRQMLALLLYLGFSSLFRSTRYRHCSAWSRRHRTKLCHRHPRIPAARDAGMRFGVIIMATLLGMAFGGWISGVISTPPDLTTPRLPTALYGTCSMPVSRWRC